MEVFAAMQYSCLAEIRIRLELCHGLLTLFAHARKVALIGTLRLRSGQAPSTLLRAGPRHIKSRASDRSIRPTQVGEVLIVQLQCMQTAGPSTW